MRKLDEVIFVFWACGGCNDIVKLLLPLLVSFAVTPFSLTLVAHALDHTMLLHVVLRKNRSKDGLKDGSTLCK